MKAPLISNYLTNLSREYENNDLDNFCVVLSDLLPQKSLCISLSADIGVEDHTKESYIIEIDKADRNYIDGMTLNTGLSVFEAILPTRDDTCAIYLFGKDEQSVLDDLKRRYDELGQGDI